MRHQTLTGKLRYRLLLLFTPFVRAYTRLFGRQPVRDRHQLSNAEHNLTLAEMRRLVAAARSQRDRLLIRLMTETGMRRCEVAALETTDIDGSRNLIMIKNSKGNKTRFVPVTSELARSLHSLETSSGFVFRSRSGIQLSCRQINRIVADAGNRAGVKNPNPKYSAVTCHLLRHSFARHWKDEGGSIETLSKILGHSSVKTTWDQYGTESLADIQRNYRRTLGKILSRQSEGEGVEICTPK